MKGPHSNIRAVFGFNDLSIWCSNHISIRHPGAIWLLSNHGHYPLGVKVAITLFELDEVAHLLVIEAARSSLSDTGNGFQCWLDDYFKTNLKQNKLEVKIASQLGFPLSCPDTEMVALSVFVKTFGRTNNSKWQFCILQQFFTDGQHFALFQVH